MTIFCLLFLLNDLQPTKYLLKEKLTPLWQSSLAPALAAVVVQDEGEPVTLVLGKRRLDGEPALATDAFHLGSNSKSMLATGLGILVQKGKLNWNDPLKRLFPAVHPDLAKATIEMLLSHFAGMPAFASEEEFADLPDYGRSSEQVMNFTKDLLKKPPHKSPGEGFGYSNAHYTVAAAVIEQLSGLSWQTFLQRELFEPLGIQAIYGWPAANSEGVWGHRIENGSLTPHSPQEDPLPAILAPAGDVALSMEDYGRYLQMHLRGLRGKKTFLAQETIAALHAPFGGEGAFAKGWGLFELSGHRASVHTGSAGTFHAVVAVVPGLNLGVAAVGNAGTPETEQAVKQFVLNWIEASTKRDEN